MSVLSDAEIKRVLEGLVVRTRQLTVVIVIFAVFALLALACALFALARVTQDERVSLQYGPARAQLSATELRLTDSEGARVELAPSGLRFFDAGGSQVVGIAAGAEEAGGGGKGPSVWVHSAKGVGSAGLLVGPGGRPELLLGAAKERRDRRRGKVHLGFDPMLNPGVTLQSARGAKVRYGTGSQQPTSQGPTSGTQKPGTAQAQD